jgi:hypothetical protein
MAGAFSGMKNAKTYDTGKYLSPGLYVVEVTKCLVKDTRASGTSFIAELKIVESNNDDHAVGSSATWFQKMVDKDIAYPAIMEFIMAVMGIDKSDKEREKQFRDEVEELMDSAVGDENVLAGMHVALETFYKTTKGKGLQFTVHKWTPHVPF